MRAGAESSPLESAWRSNTRRMNAVSLRCCAAVTVRANGARDENSSGESAAMGGTCGGGDEEEPLGSMAEAGAATVKGGGVGQR